VLALGAVAAKILDAASGAGGSGGVSSVTGAL
jgi:hypothetical protein